VIPRHRLRDEIVNHVWDHLWTEKDDQRREVYENIEDRKHELQEKEFEQRREEIRSATDRIRDLRSRIRDLRTEAKAAEGKVDEIGDLMVKYDRLHRERKQEFRSDVKEAFAEIDRQTERILEETRNEEQNRIEQAQEAAREKAEMIREEERRRQMDKFLAEQQRADERAKAEMEQRAALHEKEMGIEQRQHREDWMLKTRGRTSFSSLINRVKMRKDRLLGASAQQHGGER
jgi:DNA repair exonuclease SbcCD ATPase subunit